MYCTYYSIILYVLQYVLAYIDSLALAVGMFSL